MAGWRRIGVELLRWLGYAAARLVLAACALLAAVSIAFGMQGRLHGWIAAALWITLGVVAFRKLWNEPDRRH